MHPPLNLLHSLHCDSYWFFRNYTTFQTILRLFLKVFGNSQPPIVSLNENKDIILFVCLIDSKIGSWLVHYNYYKEMAYLGPMLINKMIVPTVLLQSHNLHLICAEEICHYQLRNPTDKKILMQNILHQRILHDANYLHPPPPSPQVSFKMLCLHDSVSLKAKCNEVRLQVLFFNYNAISHWFESESQ